MSYDFTLGKIHRLNILAGHEVSDSGGDGLKASGTYFPANFTKENAFAMINQYDSTKGVGDFSSSVSTPSRILSFFGRLNYNLMERYLLTVTFRAMVHLNLLPVTVGDIFRLPLWDGVCLKKHS